MIGPSMIALVTSGMVMVSPTAPIAAAAMIDERGAGAASGIPGAATASGSPLVGRCAPRLPSSTILSRTHRQGLIDYLVLTPGPNRRSTSAFATCIGSDSDDTLTELTRIAAGVGAGVLRRRPRHLLRPGPARRRLLPDAAVRWPDRLRLRADGRGPREHAAYVPRWRRPGRGRHRGGVRRRGSRRAGRGRAAGGPRRRAAASGLVAPRDLGVPPRGRGVAAGAPARRRARAPDRLGHRCRSLARG